MAEPIHGRVISRVTDVLVRLERIQTLLLDEFHFYINSPAGVTKDRLQEHTHVMDLLIIQCTVNTRRSFLSLWDEQHITRKSLRKCFRGRRTGTNKRRHAISVQYTSLASHINTVVQLIDWS